MKTLNRFLIDNNIKPLKYIKKNNTYIIEDGNNKFVVKKNKENDLLYEYLNSRNFSYIPKILKENKEYIMMEYINDLNIPKEQKIIDLVSLVSLLHSKTTLYKETTEDNFKELYENIKGNIDYLSMYYNDIMNIIESKVYYSPSEYLLARNISQIYKSLNFCNTKIDDWYELVKNNTKQRYVLLHNNLDLTHFIENDKSYLLSWDKSKVGLPMFDLYKLYKNHHLDFEFSEIIDEYEKNYPLKYEEKLLFLILISLPEKLDIKGSEYNKCIIISNEIDRLFKSEKLVSLSNISNNNDTYNNN